MADKTKLEKLLEEYPGVPIEVYDIEESAEMAETWLNMYGY